MATLIKRFLPFLMGLGLVTASQAGWLNPSQPGFVIQTFTSYQPISGNNSGTITTNGNSYQFAGDNTGAMYLGGPGVQFRGKNDGNVYVDGDGAFVLGSFGTLAMVTNRGKGSLILGNLSVGQKALITDVGNASLLLGAGTVSNSQAIVVGDGNESHGSRSVTAGSFWATGSGFYGNGGGLTNVPETAWAAWKGGTLVEIGTNANGTSYGIAIGPYADATNTGVAVGYAAKANDGGISMGFCATGTFESIAMSTYAHATQSGVAIGRNATGDVSGVALGASANGSTFGTALGWHTHGATQGVAVGAFAAAEPYGVAVGVSSDAGTYGTALGRGAQAVGTGNVAVGMAAHAYPVGSNWTDSVEIGAGTNLLQGGLSFRGRPIVDSNGVVVAAGPWVASGGSGTIVRLQITGTPGSNSTDAARMSDVGAAASNVAAYVDGRFAAGVDGYGHFAVVGGTQLVFVAGSVTNVLDGDITHP